MFTLRIEEELKIKERKLKTETSELL